MITLRGYGGLFNRIIRTDGHPDFVVKPGAFDPLPTKHVPIFMDHDRSKDHANRANGSVRVWQDCFGLAFECKVEDGRLVDEVRSGRRARCSLNYVMYQQPDQQIFEGEEVLTYSLISLDEISIVPMGACPGTAVWAADTDPAHMMRHQAMSARQWTVGHHFNSRRREVGRSRLDIGASNGVSMPLPVSRTPVVPHSIVNLMNSPWWEDHGQQQRHLMQLYGGGMRR